MTRPIVILLLFILLISSCIFTSNNSDDAPEPSTYSVTGTISDSDGNGMDGVAIALIGGNASYSATSDSSGNFVFTDVAPGTYVITPAAEGATFQPSTNTITVTDGDVNAQAFINTRSNDGGNDNEPQAGVIVAGSIIDPDGNPVAGVTLSITNMLNRYEAVSGDTGDFQFTGVEAGSYGLIHNKAGCEFIPSYQTIGVTDNNVRITPILCLPYSETGVYVVGHVISADGAGVEDVTTSITNLVNRYEATSNTAGYFVFSDVESGVYGLVTNKYGLMFTPDFQNINVEDDNVLIPDILATAYSGEGVPVSGRIVDTSGAGIPDVTLSLTSVLNRYEATTSSEGYYVFDGVVSGAYGLVFNKHGYTFTPDYLTVSVQTDPVSVETIVGSTGSSDEGGTYSVSGHVTTADGDGYAGVTMILGGDSENQAVTDDDGYYLFANLPAGNYMVVPNAIGVVFSPMYQAAIITDRHLTIDFTEFRESEDDGTTHSIYGSITTQAGSGISGVTLMIVGGSAQYTATTDSDGYYRANNLENNFYSVVPQKIGYLFTPPFAQVTVNGTDAAQNFTGTLLSGEDEYFDVTGRVVDGSGNGISDVTVTVTNTLMDMVVGIEHTGADGTYTFDELFEGSFTIQPEKTGYTFDPETRSVTLTQSGKTLDAFVGTREGGQDNPAGDITGRIITIFDETPIPDVWVRLENKADGDSSITYTNNDGYYSFSGIEDGEYEIMPRHAEFVFDHKTRNVDFDGEPVTDRDFLGGYLISGHAYEVVKDEDTGEVLSSRGVGGITIKLERYDFSMIAYMPTVTDATGYYVFDSPPLIPGEYKISVDDDEFKPEYYEEEIINRHLTDLDFVKGDDDDEFEPEDDGGGGDLRNFWLEIENDTTISQNNYLDETHWRGGVDFTLKFSDDGTTGTLEGEGELKVTGGGESHSDSEDSDWTRTGSVMCTIGGAMARMEDPADGELKPMLNINLGVSENASVTKTICDKDGDCRTETMSSTTPTQSFDLLMPIIDGYRIERTITPGSGVTGHVVYVLHFGSQP